MTKQSDLRKRVYCYIEKNPNQTKKLIVDHFVNEGQSKSTIYDIIKRKESGSSDIRRVGSGRPAKIFDKKGLVKLKRLVDLKDRIYQKKLATKFKCSQQYISKTLKESLKINLRKKSNIPSRTPIQQAEAKRK